MSEKVSLMCKDGETIEVDAQTASHSVLIKGMIDESGAEEVVPLPQVSKAIMDKILVFCDRLNANQPPEIDKPLSSTDMFQVVDSWHAEYINIDQE